ncbi:glycosyltransferase family 2 protein [Thermasporomyces composti]|jgi:GT2 family glycosyltransferase|uniref:GT2 family glycosyltransferase n=1 Tax=Thermasporomyces composti TaxID=696763 RepID=A0A3D9V3I6_THECX|nr:glycosyltransferase [Thermasporomyces composti]REF35946.1 GT2 family glycosyltransferase [Thermasporomyces composti]
MTDLRVSVLLVSWNTREQTRRCLASLEAAARPDVSYEVLAVDNGSRDGSAELLETWPGVHLLRNEANLGYARAVNQAYLRAGGEFVLLLSTDVCLRPGALAAMARFLANRPGAAGVVPLFLSSVPPGSLDQHYRHFPTPRTELASFTAFGRLPGFRGPLRRHLMCDDDFSEPRVVDAPVSACLLLRRSTLSPDHILDERLPLYANDTLLARSLAERGHTLWVTPDAVVAHTAGGSTRLLDPSVRSQHQIGSFVRYLQMTEPDTSLRLFRAGMWVDWLARTVTGRRRRLRRRALAAALRGELPPLPDAPLGATTAPRAGAPEPARTARESTLSSAATTPSNGQAGTTAHHADQRAPHPAERSGP